MNNNKVVFITGAGSGIGYALTKSFLKAGCRVIAADRNTECLPLLTELGAKAVLLDVNDSANIDTIVKGVIESEGSIDILINNAGFGLMGPILDINYEKMLHQFRTNVFSPIEIIQKVAPFMRQSGGGLVINMGSVSGILTTPFAGAYCASKAAFHSLTDALRMELAPFGIRVMMVQPGAISSNFGTNAANWAGNVVTPSSWYYSRIDAIMERANASQKDASPAEGLADKILSLAFSDNPPVLLRYGKKSFLLPFLKWLLPLRTVDKIFMKKLSLSSFRP